MHSQYTNSISQWVQTAAEQKAQAEAEARVAGEKIR